MNEKEKLSEAKYFLRNMIETESSRELFRYNLSAFLSASRSILQYALEEAKQNSGGPDWYGRSMRSSQIFRFFKDKRDVNIHEEPVPLKVQHNITSNETICISESIHIKRVDKCGKVLSEYHSPESGKKNSESDTSSVVSKTVYKFDDWSGSEDVLSLSEKYLQELDSFVSDGVAKRYIKG